MRWNSHGSTAEGVVERKITSRTEAGGRMIDASAEEPRYLVRSDNGEAVHKPQRCDAAVTVAALVRAGADVNARFRGPYEETQHRMGELVDRTVSRPSSGLRRGRTDRSAVVGIVIVWIVRTARDRPSRPRWQCHRRRAGDTTHAEREQQDHRPDGATFDETTHRHLRCDRAPELRQGMFGDNVLRRVRRGRAYVCQPGRRRRLPDPPPGCGGA